MNEISYELTIKKKPNQTDSTANYFLDGINHWWMAVAT